MANQEYSRFLKAIEKVNKIYIVLYYKPWGKLLRKYVFNQKKQYAIDFCIICDSDKKIIYMLTYFSNAMHNTQIWSYINIYYNFDVYLFFSQYILENAVYTFTKYIVPSYKAPKVNNLENHTFNKKLSYIQINIEHTFGILKRRQKSLTKMWLIITDNKK